MTAKTKSDKADKSPKASGASEKEKSSVASKADKASKASLKSPAKKAKGSLDKNGAASAKAGKVYLVGAGPGDPGLLTLRGAEILALADSIVYDHLAAKELLSYAPKNCRLVDAGKKANKHALSQAEINDLLVAEAKKGRTVVRLKGGDPFIFGRGGEEALRLAEEGLSFEVTPGVPAAVAAASAAGIPLTHRGMAQMATIVAGHSRDGAPEVDFAKIPGETLSIVMGRANLRPICAGLIKSGRLKTTPCAIIEWGTTPKQRTAVGTLSDLPDLADEAKIAAPALLVVGDVVTLRERLNWSEKRPLFGKTILVTRTRSQASRLVKLLQEAGARVLTAPAIAIEPLSPCPELLAAIEELKSAARGLSAQNGVSFDSDPCKGQKYLILTSPNGAEIFLKAIFEKGLDARVLAGQKIVAIGPGTAMALTPFGLRADFTPKTYQAEGIVELFRDLRLPLGRVSIFRAKNARDALPKGLSDLGYPVRDIAIYQTIEAPTGAFDHIFLEGKIDLATVTSSSVAKGLARAIPPSLLATLPVVSIGPIASATARDLGLRVAAESPKATVESLAATAIAYFQSEKA